MFRNGLHPDVAGLSMPSRVANPNLVGAGILLNARGNVYGDVRTVAPATIAKRRARNKAARIARRAARR